MAHALIHVVLIEEGTGNVVGETQLPPADLPSHFDTSTTLRVAGQDWQVVEARPTHADAFIEGGELRLLLRQVELMDPQGILYSLPTINDVLPAVDSAIPRTNGELELHEDDWRQLEFVSSAHRALIADDIASILEVHRRSAHLVGFETLHVRRAVPEPLAETGLTLATLRSCFERGDESIRAVAIRGSSAPLQRGFAMSTESSPVLYGTTNERGLLDCLGLVHWTARSGDADVSRLTRLARDHALLLVDWCPADVVEPSGLQDFFSRSE